MMRVKKVKRQRHLVLMTKRSPQNFLEMKRNIFRSRKSGRNLSLEMRSHEFFLKHALP